jgi:hypothetical protein
MGIKNKLSKLYKGLKLQKQTFYAYKKAAFLTMEIPEGYELKKYDGSVESGIKFIDSQIGKNIACYAVFHQGDLAHASFLYKKLFTNRIIGMTSLYAIGGCHTFDKYRGKGLYPYTLSVINKDYPDKTIIYVSPNNHSSIKGIEKAGYAFYKVYTITKLFYIPIKIVSDDRKLS